MTPRTSSPRSCAAKSPATRSTRTTPQFLNHVFEEGLGRITAKVGEEATEVIIAALRETPEHVTSESADLLYHLLVLWAEQGITPEDVFEELRNRAGASGIEEKQSRDRK